MEVAVQMRKRCRVIQHGYAVATELPMASAMPDRGVVAYPPKNLAEVCRSFAQIRWRENESSI